jgi:hypothetical protein
MSDTRSVSSSASGCSSYLVGERLTRIVENIRSMYKFSELKFNSGYEACGEFSRNVGFPKNCPRTEIIKFIDRYIMPPGKTTRIVKSGNERYEYVVPIGNPPLQNPLLTDGHTPPNISVAIGNGSSPLSTNSLSQPTSGLRLSRESLAQSATSWPGEFASPCKTESLDAYFESIGLDPAIHDIETVKSKIGEPDASDVEGDPVSDDNFRLITTQVHLTYKTHIPAEELRTLAGKLAVQKKHQPPYSSRPGGLLKWSIVHESADELNPYCHTHAYFMFRGKFVADNCRVFDYCAPDGTTIHPHIKIPRRDVAGVSTKLTVGSGAYIACVYHKKESGAPHFTNYPDATLPVSRTETVTKIEDGIEVTVEENRIVGYFPSVHDLIGSIDSLDCVLLTMQGPGADYKSSGKTKIAIDLAGAAAVWQSSTVLREDQLWDWQNAACIFLDLDVTRGSMMWIVGNGDDGKTAFAFFLVQKYGALRLTDGNARDLEYAILLHTERFGYPKVIIADLTRSSTSGKSTKKDFWHDDGQCASVILGPAYSKQDSFVLFENVLDGGFVSTKYIPATVMFATSPNVIVMSNTRPSASTLSPDRWLVASIGFDRKIHTFVCGSSGAQTVLRYSDFLDITGGSGDEVRSRLIKVRTNTTMDEVLEATSPEVKEYFWERGLIPIFELMTHEREEALPSDFGFGKRQKNQLVRISTRPMTDEEKRSYDRKTLERPEPVEQMFEGKPESLYSVAYKQWMWGRMPGGLPEAVQRFVEYKKAKGEKLDY